MTLRWLHLTDDELLRRLKSLLEREGRLSEALINGALGVPSINVYIERFGSLRNAYRRIGHELKWDFDWIDRSSEFDALLGETAADLAARLKKAGSVIAIRLGEGNNSVLDYFLLPTKAMTGSKIRFMEAGLYRFEGCRFRTPAQLTKAITHQLLAACGHVKRGKLPSSIL